ncbi:hypothetical protein CLV31_103121 [Algoriphagus aquaeductus]|uniref:Uncharacterized protein n=1 Tax=Algoriphagus aquaeductus TaxID=475299 RepID=A0A326RVU6_9BACT|nr:hypothetical protein CLV31_103121 [Algoriphagus aquaeductus]
MDWFERFGKRKGRKNEQAGNLWGFGNLKGFEKLVEFNLKGRFRSNSYPLSKSQEVVVRIEE